MAGILLALDCRYCATACGSISESTHEIEQSAEMVIQAVQFYVDQKFQRMAEMLKLDERLAAIEAGTNGDTKTLERRISRQGEHLGRLEDRVRALETGPAPAALMLSDRSNHVR